MYFLESGVEWCDVVCCGAAIFIFFSVLTAKVFFSVRVDWFMIKQGSAVFFVTSFYMSISIGCVRFRG